jgi:transposase
MRSLKLPPKTPDNSSTPPARGQKGSDTTPSQPKGKAHPGTHRPLHPNPTRKRDVLADQCLHCGTDVSGVTQAPVHTYDRIEIPEIKPDVTQVTLHGGVCPCCSKRFRAAPPAELEPGSVARAEEAGEEVYASVEVIWKLAGALEVSPTVLLKR